MDINFYSDVDWEYAKLLAQEAIKFAASTAKANSCKQIAIGDIVFEHTDYNNFEVDCRAGSSLENNIVLAFANQKNPIYGISCRFSFKHGCFKEEHTWKWQKSHISNIPEVGLYLPTSSRLLLANRKNVKFKC